MSGQFSHAEGYGSSAEGFLSHAEGENTRAIGSGSHAEGSRSIAEGTSSHAQGYYGHAHWYTSNAIGGDNGSQNERVVLRGFGNTTLLPGPGSSAGCPLPANFMVSFRAEVIAVSQDTTTAKTFVVTGLIRTNGSGTHSLLESSVTTIHDPGTTGFTVTVGVDATGLTLTTGGAPGRCVATVDYTQSKYA